MLTDNAYHFVTSELYLSATAMNVLYCTNRNSINMYCPNIIGDWSNKNVMCMVLLLLLLLLLACDVRCTMTRRKSPDRQGKLPSVFSDIGVAPS